MEYFVDKIQMRIVRIKRDFSYIDKIGLLTNSFINEIEGTELQRNGEYGVLIVRNEVYNFEVQIGKNEIVILISPGIEISDSSFDSMIDSFTDIIERIYMILKTHDVINIKNSKSIISVIDGHLLNYDNSIMDDFMLQECRKFSFSDSAQQVKQIIQTWIEGNSEFHLNIAKEDKKDEVNHRIIFGYQENDVKVDVTTMMELVKRSTKVYRSQIIERIRESCEN
jgi:hypothetical protein